jgi:thymidylate synthase (FAD)
MKPGDLVYVISCDLKMPHAGHRHKSTLTGADLWCDGVNWPPTMKKMTDPYRNSNPEWPSTTMVDSDTVYIGGGASYVAGEVEVDKINVLNKGYVRIVDTMGDDLSVVNAARVSYDKESDEMRPNDEKLLRYLWREGHTSPFRHASMSFEVYAPLMVARQWYKHAVASTHLDDINGWNESSRRYVTENEEFYIPDVWRSAPENSKQGSGEPVDSSKQKVWTSVLERYIAEGEFYYKKLLELGAAPEQARLFLPANGLYVRWRWTVSLHAVLHFLDLRKEHSSQWEIQQYATAVDKFVKLCFPETHKVVFDG